MIYKALHIYLHVTYEWVGLPLVFMWRCSSSTCVWGVCDVPELVIPVEASLVGGCWYHGSYWTKGSSWLSWSHHFEGFTDATMAWLTALEYLCHGWPRMCSACHGHVQVLSLLVNYPQICWWIDFTDAAGGVGAACRSGAPGFAPGFWWGSCCSIFGFECVFCGSLFVLLSFFLLAIVLFVFRFTDADYPFGIFKLFLHTYTMYLRSQVSAQVASCLIL